MLIPEVQRSQFEDKLDLYKEVDGAQREIRMNTSLDHDFRTELFDSSASYQSETGQRLFEESVPLNGKFFVPSTLPNISAAEGDNNNEGKKPPAFEIVDEQDPEAKREAVIKDVAQKSANGKFNDAAKELLLEALNSGETDAERKKSLNDVMREINKELAKTYKANGEKDPSKQFEVRFLNLKGPDGTYDRLRIGLQSRRSPDYSDSFMVRLKK